MSCEYERCWQEECICGRYGSAPVQDPFIATKPWHETESGKQQFLETVNSLFIFEKDGTIYCRECKNESVACVCMEDNNER